MCLCVAAECIPYSEQACLDAAKALGLSVEGSGDHPFSSDTFTYKGCYAYSGGSFKDKAFYGKGGSLADLRKALPSLRYRPKNYDCAADNRACMYCIFSYVCMLMFNNVCYLCKCVCTCI